jgi:imidazolonepropionase
MHSADLLITNIGELATPEGSAARSDALLASTKCLRNAAIAIVGDRIAAVGAEPEVRAAWQSAREIDAEGGLAIPGFVDSHTHPVFDGTREDEFEMRVAGKTYVEISEAGGGIVSSVRGVRGASEEQLLAKLLPRLDRFLALGTTTVESKTGYGLTHDDELKCLRVIAAANAMHPVELVPTFLGAHDFPLEFRDRKDEYVDLLYNEMLPAVAESGLAEYCDVFTESHVYNVEQSRRLMLRGRELGLGVRMHVDQLSAGGGAQLAAELGAASADHLECVSPEGIEALAAANVIPVLCPLVPLFLRVDQEAPARRMIEGGLAPALATDFNPGSCYTQSMPEVLTWAALRYGMSAAESLTAATLNAAVSLGRGDRLGSLDVGKQADIALLDLGGLAFLTYEFGWNPVLKVFKAGELVHERGARAIG